MSKKKKQLEDFESIYPNDTFLRITKSMLLSPAYKSLTRSQIALYQFMKFQYYNNKNKPNKNNSKQFNFNKKLYCDTYKLYSNDDTFRKDRDTLIEKGFIKCVEMGANTRTKAIYEFSTMWQYYDTDKFVIENKDKTLSLQRK